jgi:hypothetical protein
MDKKEDNPYISLRDVANQLKKNAQAQHKDFLAGTIINRKELNDLEQGLNRLNKSLEKLTKIISSSSVLEKSMSVQSKGARRFYGGSAEVVTNPQMGRMLREDKRAVNVRDLFGNFFNRDSKSQDNYFFQSGSQARQREELKIKMKKGEIDQQEFDEMSQKIGTTGGFADFFKDFKAGLQDAVNFFTNKNVVQTEQSLLKEAPAKMEVMKSETAIKNEVFNKILGEVSIIRKILESSMKKPRTERTRRQATTERQPRTDVSIYRNRPTVSRRMLSDQSKIIDVSAKEIRKVPLLTSSSNTSTVQALPPPTRPMLPNESNIIDVEAKPTSTKETDTNIGDVTIVGAGAATAGKAGSKMGRFLRGAGRVLGKIAAPLAIATSAYEGFEGYNEAKDNLDIKDREATLGEKLSSAGGSIVSGLTFGLLDKKEASKGIAKFFGAGQTASNMTAAQKSESVTQLSEENATLRDQGNKANNTVINNINQAPAQQPAAAMGPSPMTRPPESSLEKYLDRNAVYA